MLHRAIADDALHNSVDRYPQPKCYPETRTEMLDDLCDWASRDDPASRVLWIHGPAGAGKSAIAQSLSQLLEEKGSLGGSFFFKRDHPSRGHAGKLFFTIAYQLGLLLPELKQVVSQCMEDDPSVIHKSLPIQLQKLIIEPCQQVLPHALTIVIDGLDECENIEVQQEILCSIGNAVHRAHIALRFLVGSRPEPHIGEAFREPRLAGYHRPWNIHQSFQDVRRYLQNEFIRIHVKHYETMDKIHMPWPSANIVEDLVAKSSGYFVYASTVVKFIDDKSFRPTDRLDVILGLAKPEDGSGLPFGVPRGNRDSKNGYRVEKFFSALLKTPLPPILPYRASNSQP
ncbi:hypothetical protein B0H17DRAFT_670121 [Mycena rosella]|uniref:Nephrocystin 3-like N-terminal domain-containing protein n=1 Tax=Mycena rosella TaxID=1033263 RepID=A0AAD7GUE1_MYCRO|nr:hypothetical protein B0H17DRAFT_670121 [Mycena rosella]